ncbi:MAG: hypothetical protein WCA59_00295 [Candidatus Binataceae bacterium]
MKRNYLNAKARRFKEDLKSTPSDRIEKSSWFRALVESSAELIAVVSASSFRIRDLARRDRAQTVSESAS